jgi:hypothetical protein
MFVRSLILSITMAIMAYSLAPAQFASGGRPNLALDGTASASSTVGQPGGKYMPADALDDREDSWWAANVKQLPQWLEITFPEARRVDTLALWGSTQSNLYNHPARIIVSTEAGVLLEQELPDSPGPYVLKFAPVTTKSVRVTIPEVHQPLKHYVGLAEVRLFDDPEGRVKVRVSPVSKWREVDRTPNPPARHPCVYHTPEDVQAARQRIQTEPWARDYAAGVIRLAEAALARPEEWFRQMMPAQGACFAYGFTGCPICKSSWGTWGGARCSWDKPGQVTCSRGHVLPDAEHPDPGTGYHGPDGRIHYFVGSWNAWVTEKFIHEFAGNLALAYAFTGEEKYAARAAFILDLIADIYPSCDKGSWDYPSNPPSGRLARPWYQVSRVLVRLVDFYDLIYHSESLNGPSVTEGLTRRQNIERNMILNGAEYCYQESFKGGLHNGEADYVRGVLAVGCLLGIEPWVEWAYNGPFGILALVHNNVCRDGRYFETSVMYADHTRELYLTFAEPLYNYRSAKYPQGINLYQDPVFRSFYQLPSTTISCLGHAPRFGDSAPDLHRIPPPLRPSDPLDRHFAEILFARSDEQTRPAQAALLSYLAGDSLAQARATVADKEWMVFHAAPWPDNSEPLPEALRRRLEGTHFFGQKGLALLRTRPGSQAQAALLRFGPSLNHGHLDDLNLNYYALGYELTYDLGYGLGSTHTQVGWARQTASHNLVLVNERSQGPDRLQDGSGGSLHLLNSFPHLQLADASAEATYKSLGVSEYRRVCALVGDGPQTYLWDVFRVQGGQQHDYILHALSSDATFEGVTLGEPAAGSLAGPDIAWGDKQGNDGDMAGYPNKPYWNPPPGNGLGFLMAPQRGALSGPCTATWDLPENTGHLRLTLLPEPGTELITAWAPGIYPQGQGSYSAAGGYPRSRYVLARRQSQQPLSSAYCAVLEPYADPPERGLMTSLQLTSIATATGGQLLHIPSVNVLLWKATGAQDVLTLPVQVPSAGAYVLNFTVYGSQRYGQGEVSVAGKVLGPVNTRPGTSHTDRLGPVELSAGPCEVQLKITKPSAGVDYWLGLQSLQLVPADVAAKSRPPVAPFLRRSQRLAAPEGVVAARVELTSGRVDNLLHNTRLGQPVKVGEGAAALTTDARFARFSTREGKLVAAALVGGTTLQAGGVTLSLPRSEYRGTLRQVDYQTCRLQTDTPLPADGRLNGALIYITNSRYSRNTVYRLESVRREGAGSVLDLGDTSLVLGFADLDEDPLDEQTLTTLNPHEYSRGLGRADTQFFNGKRIATADGRLSTTLRSTIFGQPFRLKVDSVEGFKQGDRIYYYDVQAGDEFVIILAAGLSESRDGTLQVNATEDLTLTATMPVQVKHGDQWRTAEGGKLPWRKTPYQLLLRDSPPPAPSAQPAGKLIAPQGAVVFRDDFTAGLDNWRQEGGGQVSIPEPGVLRLDCTGSRQGGVGCQLFLQRDLPDGIALDYDLQVHKSNGLVINFIGMQGLGGEDMFLDLPPRSGIFYDYVGPEAALRSYHVSISRYNDKGEHTGVSNWRRNPGAHLLAQGPDLCKEIGRRYQVRLVKDGPHLQLSVNGVVAHDFVDPHWLPGEIPTLGKFGFRAIGSEVIAEVRNVVVRKLR